MSECKTAETHIKLAFECITGLYKQQSKEFLKIFWFSWPLACFCLCRLRPPALSSDSLGPFSGAGPTGQNGDRAGGVRAGGGHLGPADRFVLPLQSYVFRRPQAFGGSTAAVVEQGGSRRESALLHACPTNAATPATTQQTPDEPAGLLFLCHSPPDQEDPQAQGGGPAQAAGFNASPQRQAPPSAVSGSNKGHDPQPAN